MAMRMFFGSAFLVTAALLLWVSPSYAGQQELGYRIMPQDIKVEAVDVPIRSINGRPKNGSKISQDLGASNAKWIEIEVKFEADPKRTPEDTSDYFDELNVKIHLNTPEPPPGSKEPDWPEVLTADLKYSTVKKGREIFAVAYLPPPLVARMGGVNAFQPQTKMNVAIEIFVKGKLVADQEKNEKVGKPGWYEKGGKTGVLIPITKTPFAMDYWDRYYPLSESSAK